jgi:hypothetical protein
VWVSVLPGLGAMLSRPDRLGLLLPSPSAVASPTRAAHLVSELAESIAYTHGLEEVLVAKSWWSKRICARLGLATCSEAESPEEVVEESPEMVEALVDGSRPRAPQRLRCPCEKRLLSYYIDSRRGGILFLGARRLLVHA